MRFGAGKGVTGTVLLLTLGTGIGSALFIDGVLVPNTEFGHIQIRGKDAEKRASEHAREEHDLSWGDWAGRVDEYLEQMEALMSPGLIIIGGGVSRKSDKFLPLLTRPAGQGRTRGAAERRGHRRRRHGRRRREQAAPRYTSSRHALASLTAAYRGAEPRRRRAAGRRLRPARRWPAD